MLSFCYSKLWNCLLLQLPYFQWFHCSLNLLCILCPFSLCHLPCLPEFPGCIHLEGTGGLGAQLERTLPTFNTISYFAASSQEPVLCLCYYPRHISIELSHCLHYVLMPPGFLISSPLYTLLLLLQLPHKSWVTYAVPVNSCLTACPTSPWLFSPLITPSTQPRINYQDDIWIAYRVFFFSFFFLFLYFFNLILFLFYHSYSHY